MSFVPSSLNVGRPGVDPRLIEACRAGDRDAFRELFMARKDQVYSLAFHFFGGDRSAAGDVTQEVFLKVLSRIGQYREDARFSTWLYRIAVNTCIDEMRKRRRWVSMDEEGAEAAMAGRMESRREDPRADVARAVQKAVASLKPRLKAALLLRYFEGLSYDEIGAALGCSRGTVASRLNRGHRMLAKKLGHLREALRVGDEPCS